MIKRTIELIQSGNIQLRWKLLLGFFLVIGFLLLALGVAIATLFNSTNNVKNFQNSIARSEAVSEIKLSQSLMASSALDYLKSNNFEQLQDYENIRGRLETALAKFTPTANQKQKFENLKSALASLRGVLDDMITYQDSSREADAAAIWRQRGSVQLRLTLSLADELTAEENRSVDQSYNTALDQSITTTWIVSGLTLLALALALAVALLLTEAIVRPILQLRDVLSNLAKGDLTQELNFKNKDEFAQLKTTFNASLSSLQGLIRQLYIESEKVNTVSEELTLQAKTQVTGSSQQVSIINEATETLQELNHTALSISRQIETVAHAAELSLEEAQTVSAMVDRMALAQEEGRSTIAHTLEALRNLKSQIEIIEGQQQNLREQSKVIEEVVDIIDNISRETHLLALNAAIEAAGAGEAGHRFSVIAREVKKLSDRSINATQKVRSNLSGITDTIEQASLEAEKALRVAELAVNDASNSDETLINLANFSLKVKNATHNILNMVENTTNMATEIGVASTQQQVANGMMLDKMVEVKQVTSHTLESVTEGEKATEKLNVSAFDLKQAASNFKLVA